MWLGPLWRVGPGEALPVYSLKVEQIKVNYVACAACAGVKLNIVQLLFRIWRGPYTEHPTFKTCFTFFPPFSRVFCIIVVHTRAAGTRAPGVSTFLKEIFSKGKGRKNMLHQSPGGLLVRHCEGTRSAPNWTSSIFQSVLVVMCSHEECVLFMLY